LELELQLFLLGERPSQTLNVEEVFGFFARSGLRTESHRGAANGGIALARSGGPYISDIAPGLGKVKEQHNQACNYRNDK
jgi:hypothetical protein